MHEIISHPVNADRAVEVHRDADGTYWVGLTIIRNPRDWTFSPREQYGTGPHGLAMALKRAASWARELRFDAAAPRHTVAALDAAWRATHPNGKPSDRP